MRCSVWPAMALSRHGLRCTSRDCLSSMHLVECWTIEIAHGRRELFSFTVTDDLQFWNSTLWWADRAPEWWKTL